MSRQPGISLSSGPTAVVVGPVYVDLHAVDIGIPGIEIHAKLRPYGSGSWTPEVGGSAWKFATYWAEHFGRALFVTSIARDLGTDDSSNGEDHKVFVDDGSWLRREIRSRSPQGLEVFIDDAPAGSTDYTFHLRKGGDEYGPLVSLVNGSADALRFDAIKRALRTFKWNDSPDLLVLSGIARTANLHLEPLSARPRELKQTRLCIDLGRTDIQVPRDGLDLIERFRPEELFAICADFRTADLLGWLEGTPPGSEWLVVRPGIASHDWHFLHTDPDRRLEGRALRVGPDSRPHATAKSLHRLLVDPQSIKSEGSVIVPGGTPQLARDITSDKPLLKDLEFLEWKLRNDRRLKTILLVGETGTGKEVIARWLHRAHPTRHEHEFVPVACGKLDKESAMLESELFGHVEGAFTGATRTRTGAFKDADKGVILIDDLDALPFATQAKLLRVLEDGRVSPLGSSVDEIVDVDVLTVVTTNVNPSELVRQEKLRDDLYYRLVQGFYLPIPPLRNRRKDALRLAQRLWDTRNLWAHSNHAFPTVMKRWIEVSDLIGNTRLLAAVVNDIHDYIEFSGSSESVAERFKAWLGQFDPDRLVQLRDQPKLVEQWPAKERALFEAIAREIGDTLPTRDDERVVLFATSWLNVQARFVGVRLKAADIRDFLRLQSSFGRVRTNLLKRRDTTDDERRILDALDSPGGGAGAVWTARVDD